MASGGPGRGGIDVTQLKLRFINYVTIMSSIL